MSEFYDEIIASVDETIAASKKNQLKETIFIKPIKKYDSDGIKRIRKSLNLKQALFSGVLGVSPKTVEAWESGRNIPMGPASRVLDLLAEDKELADRFMKMG